MTEQNISYSLEVTLLEDLHSGTGTGNTTVDAVQARDEQGLPIIDRHHFRGVMKDNALRLQALGILGIKQINTLFGRQGGKQRKLDCSSLLTDKKDCLIYWDSTARQKDSRCPEDNSLRRIEYIKAGTKLTGQISLTQVTDEDIEAFKQILRFTTRLGAERTRGSGQIKIQFEEDAPTPENSNIEEIENGTNTIRLLLKNTEPLCIPVNAYAGNIIRTESHIPGRIIFAAICAKAYQSEYDEAQFKNLFTDKLKIGNAYPVAKYFAAQDIEKLQSLPMPNHIHKIKQHASTQAENDLRWPHWTKTEIAPLLTTKSDVDILKEKNPAAKTSRPKGAIYLLKDESGNWLRYQQNLTIRMRNKRGDPLDKKIKAKQTELFSEQRIPANTCFLLDINCTEEKLLKNISRWLNDAQGLKIGRSKAPVRVIAQKNITQQENEVLDDTVDTKASLSIIAVSDWIIRSHNLGYLTQLNKKTLLNAFAVSNIERFDHLKLEAKQETETQGSFNYATNLPKKPFEVIKRGSVFEFEGEGEKITALLAELEKVAIAIGERVTEGYGQFVINLPIEIKDHIKIQKAEAEQQEKQEQEEAQRKIDEAIKKAKQEQEQVQKQIDDDVKKAIEDAKTYHGKFCKNLKEWKENASEEVNISEEAWQNIVIEILKSDEGIIKIIQDQEKHIVNFLHTSQKTNNLGQKLTGSYRQEKPQALTAFLDEFGRLLFAGENNG